MVYSDSQVINFVRECREVISAKCSWDVGGYLLVVFPSCPGGNWDFTSQCLSKVFVFCQV